MAVTRKQALASLAAAAAAATTNGPAAAALAPVPDAGIAGADLAAFERVAGLAFSPEERAEALPSVREQRGLIDDLRARVPDGLPDPRTAFMPVGGGSRPGSRVSARPSAVPALRAASLSDEDLAFLSVRELGALIRRGGVTPTHLTRICLERLKKWGPKLLCLVTLTEELALEQAARAEAELAAGHDRGPLHGIPFGLKDLFATKAIATGWGASPFEGRVPGEDAAVVRRLREAGAVLCAKLSMGSLAMGDVWDRGTTKNPWNPAEGSSGSSAGSAAAVSAGLLPFAIGTETQGSITSPSERCRVTGLRPTYGRVSRQGAMELTYTMDKIGPICREAEDCALVFAAICGADPRDPASVDRPFLWPPRVEWSRLNVGFLTAPDGSGAGRERIEADPTLRFLRERGAKLRPLNLTPLPDVCELILLVEAASAFDSLTRSGRVNEVKNSAWPALFRAARYLPAVEYLQAQRLRGEAMRRAESELSDLDLFVSRGIGEHTVSLVNQCGYPQVIIPQGADEKGRSRAVSFTGRIYGEALILAVAREVQRQASFHRLRPDLSAFA